jgi:FtsZ-binding cell division protein ZapB
MEKWLTGLSPVLVVIVGFILNRSAKKKDTEREEKNKNIETLLNGVNDTMQTLIMKIDDLEEYKASKTSFEEHVEKERADMKELWNTFRENQSTVAEKLGKLEGQMSGK